MANKAIKNSLNKKFTKLESEMIVLKNRINKLEKALDEKDRELREISIHRSEFIQQIDKLKKMLSTTRLKAASPKVVSQALEMKHKDKKSTVKKDKKVDLKVGNASAKLGFLDVIETDKIDFLGKYSYRERMILMNRIDIYRLYITVIILSSEIKYPRVLLKTEQQELKMFIEELNEFESMILDLNVDENILWEKGKNCEKQILQLFSNFFNL